jgi:ABC-type glycerol-3-phosphate transport system substrate-binding protein
MKKISIVLYYAAVLTLAGCGGGTGSPAASSNSPSVSSVIVSKGTVAKSVAGASGQEVTVTMPGFCADKAA